MSTILEALRKLQQEGNGKTDRVAEAADSGESAEPTGPEESPAPTASDTDPTFRPIEDPDALDVFMSTATEGDAAEPESPELPDSSTVESAEARRRAPQAPVAGLGGDWRDYQPEPFRRTPPEADADEALSGQGADSVDDGPGIYDEAPIPGDEAVSGQRRSWLIAGVAVSAGLLVGYFAVRTTLQGEPNVPKATATRPVVEVARKKPGAALKKSASKPGRHQKRSPTPKASAKASAKPSAAPASAPIAKSASPQPAPVHQPSASSAAAAPAASVAGTPRSRSIVAPAAKPASPPSAGPGAKPAPNGVAASAKPTAPAPAEAEVSLTAPAGAPHVEIAFIQWARNPAQRLVSLRNLAGTLLVLREGDLADPAEGMKVAHIGPKWVDFSWKKSLFRISMSDF